MKVNRIFLEAVVNIASCADQSGIRPALGFIRLRKVGDKIQLAATNSYFLCFREIDADCVETELGPDGAFPGGDLFIEAGKPAVKIYKALIAQSVGQYGKNNAPVYIDAAGGYIMRGKEVSYPDISQIIPKEEQYQDLSIGLNAEYLLTMLEAMRSENKIKGVKLQFKAIKKAGEGESVTVKLDSAAPIRVVVGGTFGVLMPMRL